MKEICSDKQYVQTFNGEILAKICRELIAGKFWPNPVRGPASSEGRILGLVGRTLARGSARRRTAVPRAHSVRSQQERRAKDSVCELDGNDFQRLKAAES